MKGNKIIKILAPSNSPKSTVTISRTMTSFLSWRTTSVVFTAFYCINKLILPSHAGFQFSPVSVLLSCPCLSVVVFFKT